MQQSVCSRSCVVPPLHHYPSTPTPLQLSALNGREEAGGLGGRGAAAARTSETIRIPVGVERLQSADTTGHSPPSGRNKI